MGDFINELSDDEKQKKGAADDVKGTTLKEINLAMYEEHCVFEPSTKT